MMSKKADSPVEAQASISEETALDAVETIGSGEREGAYAEALRSELEGARAESAELKDRFLRKAAEFENYRKRSVKDRNDAVELAKISVFLELLPVMDACERAMATFKSDDGPGLDQYRAGVELLYRQLRDTLARLGVVPIDAEGKLFDPNLHEALAREESKDRPENTVLRELRRGYLFRERLLRPAQVAVTYRPRTDDPGESPAAR